MSLSFTENTDISRSYIKLEIHQSQVYQNIPIPKPYGISVLLDNFPQKNIEPITKDNETFDSSINILVFNIDEKFFSKNYNKEKVFIINIFCYI